jgi:hypothetical protein
MRRASMEWARRGEDAAVPEPAPSPTRVTFPRIAWAGMALVLLTQIALLAVQLGLIEDQRTTTDDQLRATVQQANALLPLIEDAHPLVESLDESRPQLRRLGRDTTELLGELTPLARDLGDARADEQLQAAGALARTLLQADVGSATRATRHLALTLLDADLPATTRAVNGFLGRARDHRILERSARAAAEVPQLSSLLRRSVAIQEQTLAIQRETLAIARQTNTAAQSAARSAESVDRKTGGSPPPAPGIAQP